MFISTPESAVLRKTMSGSPSQRLRMGSENMRMIKLKVWLVLQFLLMYAAKADAGMPPMSN